MQSSNEKPVENRENVNEEVKETVTKVEVVEASSSEQVVAKEQTRAEMALDRIKKAAGDLVDIGIYEGGRAIQYVKSTQSYVISDKYVHYDEKLAQLQEKSSELATMVNDKITPYKNDLIVFYNDATEYISCLVQVLRENQAKVQEYIKKQYDNVTVLVQGAWIRLDFDKDGKVTLDDLKKSLNELYTFLKDFDYIEATTNIKSQIYQEAQQYLKLQSSEAKEENADADKQKQTGIDQID